jgi:hypothetical protein
MYKDSLLSFKLKKGIRINRTWTVIKACTYIDIHTLSKTAHDSMIPCTRSTHFGLRKVLCSDAQARCCTFHHHRVILSTQPEFRLPFFSSFLFNIIFFYAFLHGVALHVLLTITKKESMLQKNSRIWTGEKLWTNSRAKWFNIEFLKYFCWAVQFSSFILTVSNCLARQKLSNYTFKEGFPFFFPFHFCSAYVNICKKFSIFIIIIRYVKLSFIH